MRAFFLPSGQFANIVILFGGAHQPQMVSPFSIESFSIRETLSLIHIKWRSQVQSRFFAVDFMHICKVGGLRVHRALC